MTLGKPTDEKVAADRDLQEHQQTFILLEILSVAKKMVIRANGAHVEFSLD